MVLPAGIALIDHSKGSGARELAKDKNFGEVSGSKRMVDFDLGPATGYTPHKHERMNERFEGVEGTLTLFIYKEDGHGNLLPDSRERIELSPGETAVVWSNTPHAVVNEQAVLCTAIAVQTIVEPGGKTVHFPVE